MEEKKKRLERAKQFAPFNALKGYEELIKNQEKVICERRELGEDDLNELSEKMSKVKKGSLVTIEFYDEDGYITRKGMVSQIDYIKRRITIVKTVILFDDIVRIELND